MAVMFSGGCKNLSVVLGLCTRKFENTRAMIYLPLCVSVFVSRRCVQYLRMLIKGA